jgi:sialate O-acetylesterase
MRILPTLISTAAAAAALLTTSIAGPSARADVKLPPFFSDHMVLQRDAKAPLWGSAAPGEEITVRFRDQQKKTTADPAGNWRVELTGLKAGGPDELTIAGKNTITLKDVLVGEVWVGSGQSNMGGRVGGYAVNDPALAAMAARAYPQIRGCQASSAWDVSSPDTNGKYSALLFSMAVRLHEELDVPVGMMLGAVGGTPSGAWLSPAALAADEPAQKQLTAYATAYPELAKKYEEVDLPRWKQQAEKLKAAGRGEPRALRGPFPPGTVAGKPIGYLYEQNIRPFVGYGIRGVLWDQGEAQTQVGGVDQYTMMGALIRGWRKEWNVGDFPFIYVQKPSGNGCAWEAPPAKPAAESASAETKAPADPAKTLPAVIQPFGELPAKVPTTAEGLYVEHYVKMMKYPNAAMVISTDLGTGIHPIIKSGYGARAAQVALAIAYDKPVEYYGPVYDSHAVEGNSVRVKFTHVGRGLAVRHSEKLQGFAIAGDDRVFHWADAKIDGDTVVVSCPAVPKPVAVRYAWGPINNRTWANLFNADRFPAVTFRTDDWTE